MKLDRVTMTGADDSVINPRDLDDISQEYPFVEFGVLVSASQTCDGVPRFPSLAWIHGLKKFPELNLSLHVCGRWVRMLLAGHVDPVLLNLASDNYQRIQLNFHAERNECDPKAMVRALERLKAYGPNKDRQFIFQIDGEMGADHLNDVEEYNDDGLDIVGLFDVSHGAGMLPDSWPSPDDALMHLHGYYGYAGGLGPDNLAKQIPLIGEAAGSYRHWIDMETQIRSNDDRQFDLAKVRKCLEIAKPFITGDA